MDQQLVEEHHMRLPPPVNVNGKANTTPTAASPASVSATQLPLGADSSPFAQKTSHQYMQPAQKTQSRPISALSPPFKHANASGHANASLVTTNRSHNNHNHQPRTSSSLSPRPLSLLPVSAPAYAPPSYAFSQQQNHDPSTIVFPDPPSTELAPLQLNAHENSVSSLPSLAYLTGASATAASLRFGPSSANNDDKSYSPPPSRVRTWPTGNPYSAYYTGGHGHSADSPARMDIDSLSNGTRGPLSPDVIGCRPSSVSLDDPDVRMAAEALGDLKADFVSSPRNKSHALPNSTANQFGTSGQPEAEPLLSLVMTSGSLLAKPIEGTVSAYNTTKNFSPGFIKTPVEYVEGVVGSGLHLTGIEGGVRWFFRGKGRHPSSSDLEAGVNSPKRRKVDNRGGSTSAPRRGDLAPLTSTNSPEVEPYGLGSDKERRLSMSTVDTLPAYDDMRSPAYTEDAMVISNDKGDADGRTSPTPSRPSSTTPTAWQSRLIMSTSGLSIAMSEESLRSLKYCLSWLRWANDHIGRVISALKAALEKYDSRYGNLSPDGDEDMEDGAAYDHQEDSEQARRELGARISALRSDVLRTLQGVIETVSKYAGGALPDNARMLVRRHLTSLPQRFRMATQESAAGPTAAAGGGGGASPAPSTSEGKENEVREGAQRVLVLAKEGLDMMSQVSDVLDGTILSAEEWCERLGRKRRDDKEQPTTTTTTTGEGEGERQAEAQPQQPPAPTPSVPLAGDGVDGDHTMQDTMC